MPVVFFGFCIKKNICYTNKISATYFGNMRLEKRKDISEEVTVRSPALEDQELIRLVWKGSQQEL